MSAVNAVNERRIGMRGRTLELVNGNAYFTPYGVYVCEVIEDNCWGDGFDLIRVEVRLRNKKDPTQSVRLFTILGTGEGIEKHRMEVVFDIHRWALLKRGAEEYLRKSSSYISSTALL
jgi:hypothetical protein